LTCEWISHSLFIYDSKTQNESQVRRTSCKLPSTFTYAPLFLNSGFLENSSDSCYSLRKCLNFFSKLDRRTPARRLKEFHLFPKLPTELRLMVRQQALPGPRTITIKPRKRCLAKEMFDTGEIALGICWANGAVALTRTPSIFQTNRESREVALKFYEPSFGHLLNGNPVYFNHDLGCLHLIVTLLLSSSIKPLVVTTPGWKTSKW
jgi:hypothetical protein